MLTRNNSRQLALQSLFAIENRLLDKKNKDTKKIQETEVLKIYTYIFNLFYKEKSSGEDEFSKGIVLGVIKNLKKIDDYINFYAKNWSIEKTTIIDKNILRIAIFEMLFSDVEMPGKVVMNEAIENAKKYGHKKSYKFISGLLGAIYKKFNLAQQDEKLSKQPKKLVEKKKLGALCYAKRNNQIEFLLIHNIFGNWTLPKGSVEEDFDNINDALNSILLKKINIKGVAGDMIGKNEYSSVKDTRNIIKKEIIYFTFNVQNPEDIKIDKKNQGLNNIKWFTKEDIKKAKTYNDLKIIIEKGIEIVELQNE